MNEPRRLYRSERDRVIAGVCGGLGEYFDVDPVLIRLIFIVIFLFGGSGIVAYIIMWVLIPTESSIKENLSSEEYIRKNSDELKDKAETFAKDISHSVDHENGRIIIGVFIALIGVCFLSTNFGFFPLFDIWKLWPLVLVVIGFILIFKFKR